FYDHVCFTDDEAVTSTVKRNLSEAFDGVGEINGNKRFKAIKIEKE
ncbi:hypothetical protein A2U01_0037185, partial [Trifolium medium]|nr:hypothetical protein [Trifolium medium]